MTRPAHGTGCVFGLLICVPFWAGVIWLLSACAAVETAVTLEARALYPIPEELRIEDYELRDGWLITGGKAIAHHVELPAGALQSHCADRAGALGYLAVGCTYWQAGDPLPTIAVHIGAADYTIRHEGAHALAMLAGWGPSTLTAHWGEPA